MRVSTLPTATRFAFLLPVAATLTLAYPTSALAGDVANGSDAVVGPNSSTGAAALHYEALDGLPTSIQTGFLGPSIAQVNVGIKIDPVINGGPLYVVDMPRGALVEASWGNDKRIVFKALTGLQTDGSVTVRHTLTPSADFNFGFVKFSLDATKLLNKVPGASFNFDSRATQQFAPWAFTAIDTKLTAPDLDNAELFSLGMDDLPDFVANEIKGNFGVRATTEPTFSYRTTQITLAGAPGVLTDAAGNVTLPAVDGDAIDIMATVAGTMTVAGSIQIQPFVRIDQIGSLPAIPFDLGINVFEQDYTVPPQTVSFQTVNVHIPMPNVRVPTDTVNLGGGGGVGAQGTVTIQNTGEKEASVTFQSSSSQFSVTGDRVTIAAKSTYDLQVSYSSSDGAAPAGEIKVLSNDADSPEQTIKLGANAGDSSAAGNADGATGGKSDSGCGCKAAGTGSPVQVPGWGAFGLFGLGALVIDRRRRSRRAPRRSEGRARKQ